ASAPSHDVYVGPNVYQTGDAVIYRTSGPNNPIEPLSDQTTYYVVKDPSHPYTIQLATSEANAMATPPVVVPVTSGGSAAANAIASLVHPPVTGLTSGQSYTLKLVDASAHTYELLDPNGRVVPIDASGTWGTHELFRDGVALQSGSGTQQLFI